MAQWGLQKTGLIIIQVKLHSRRANMKQALNPKRSTFLWKIALEIYTRDAVGLFSQAMSF